MLQLHCESSGLPRSGDKRVNSNVYRWTAAARREKSIQNKKPVPLLQTLGLIVAQYLDI